MKSPDSLDVAAHCARAALAMMERNKVPPHPENYAIWYSYVAGRNPDLTAAIDAILNAGKKFTQKINDELYERFAVFPQDTAELREVGQRVEEAVGRVLEYLSNAGQGTANYGAALEDFSGKLASGPSAGALSELISGMLAETKVMADLNRQLELRLENSSGEVARLRNQLDDLKREASTDALTQLANRKLFDHSLNLAVLDAQASEAPLSLLMIDIDHFKQFNDTYGHQLGDQVLKLVARSLSEIAQAKDTAARYGGEEFAVILPATPLEKSMEVAEAIRNQVSTKRLTNRRTGQVLGQVTLSIGAARLKDAEPADSLVHRADEAMYLAKRDGRNRVKNEIDLEKAASDAGK
ncbi:diguanylate cyclase/phosphodiesterase (GGDEF & EAL domains) with PAS/PAC sensor(s) [Paramagnetospirillum magnetotacticum MS-1]|uniref:diguanylate cyclase n=1 Tax=Paramagnetospirillum magnetotacticum MS-1 TaxID=272627 RepID=A0A0C2YHI6_PARME|nr:GGDEF domain-containing protein [Paramagnetospirillum magnetotacticum]KIL99164.1 diguanylate cyclase/phosphodiesterase (GGDEF & EAL domains) with PAS/PAC sensor(s) [Paramagnetospirillum magnetotacticum MS-1]